MGRIKQIPMNNDLLFNTLSGISFLSADFKEYLSEHIIYYIFQKGDHMPYWEFRQN